MAFCSTSKIAIPARIQLADHREYFLHDQRRKAERRFVEQEQFRSRHQRAGQSEHLLLSARERAGQLLAAFLENRKHLVHRTKVVANLGRVIACVRTKLQILAHRESREKTCRPSGELRDSEPDNFVRRVANERFAGKMNFPAVGLRTPEMVRSVLLLPAPLGRRSS